MPNVNNPPSSLQGNVYWAELTTQSFGSINTESTIALLPVAAIEQHGPHLPLDTDVQICRGLVKQVMANKATGQQLIALPLMEIGESSEHSNFPGTLSFSPEYLIPLWTSLGKQIQKVGIKKLLILNTHGGQPTIVDLVAQRLRTEDQMLVVGVNSFRLGIPDDLFDPQEITNGIHAGEIETSMMLHLNPSAVEKDLSENFVSDSPLTNGRHPHIGLGGFARASWQAQDLTRQGAIGNASKADPERGALLIEHMVNKILQVLSDMARFPLSSLRSEKT
jgi:creatinine amidohydrolase